MRAFDIVIVGAGSAGCVLANRLSADPRCRVALIEAGPADRSALIRVPGLFSPMYRSGKFLWVYETAAQAGVDGRRLRDVRGRVLGGSSSVNGMLYCRGAATDYDGWAAAGNAGWSYRDVLPYFRRSEDHAGGESPWRGVGGPLHVARSEVRHPLAQAFIRAGIEAGFPANPDINGADREGFGPAESTIWRGRRWSAASAYLRPALRRPNLSVITDALVTRVVLEGRAATGVELVRQGRTERINAAEVILSAGAFQSPHLLMLSGIGDADALSAAGVEPSVDLPGVGRNLHDHASITAHARCAAPISLSSLTRPAVAARTLMQAFVRRTGAFAECPIEAVGMIRSVPEMPAPDIKCQFVPIRLDAFTGLPLPEHGMLNRLELTVPESRGRIGLASADPRAAPVIDPDLLSDPSDVIRLRAALRTAIDLYRQPAFAPFGVVPDTPFDIDDDTAIDAYIRATLTVDHHAAGTCAMGAGPNAVVDPRLRVHGVDGLRVVDAAIMPRVVSGNTSAPVMMIAEKASDMILGRDPPAAALHGGDGRHG